MNGLQALWMRYKLVIVMVPSLIGIHYGWALLQIHPPVPDQKVKPVKLFGITWTKTPEESSD